MGKQSHNAIGDSYMANRKMPFFPFILFFSPEDVIGACQRGIDQYRVVNGAIGKERACTWPVTRR